MTNRDGTCSKKKNDMMLPDNIVDIVKKLQNAVIYMPKIWDGREAILEMRDGGSRQWRQMEWMGFYFEYLCEKHLSQIIEIPGKKYEKYLMMLWLQHSIFIK